MNDLQSVAASDFQKQKMWWTSSGNLLTTQSRDAKMNSTSSQQGEKRFIISHSVIGSAGLHGLFSPERSLFARCKGTNQGKLLKRARKSKQHEQYM